MFGSCVISYLPCACDPHKLNTSFQRFLSYYRKVSVVLFWKQLVQNTVERISSRVTLMSVASRRLPCL